MLEVDPDLYRVHEREDEANWRVPLLEHDVIRGTWSAWITAQYPNGPVRTSGTLALAESQDLVR